MQEPDFTAENGESLLSHL